VTNLTRRLCHHLSFRAARADTFSYGGALPVERTSRYATGRRCWGYLRQNDLLAGRRTAYGYGVCGLPDVVHIAFATGRLRFATHRGADRTKFDRNIWTRRAGTHSLDDQEVWPSPPWRDRTSMPPPTRCHSLRTPTAPAPLLLPKTSPFWTRAVGGRLRGRCRSPDDPSATSSLQPARAGHGRGAAPPHPRFCAHIQRGAPHKNCQKKAWMEG